MSLALFPPDPAWDDVAAERIAKLREELGDRPSIEHVGSTALPGMPAKPVIDLIVGTDEDLEQLEARLVGLGYERVPLKTTERRFVTQGGKPRTNVHVVAANGRVWYRYLGFRDALRNNDELRAGYLRIKQQLSARYGTRDSRYGAGKDAFITAVLERSGGAAARVPLPGPTWGAVSDEYGDGNGNGNGDGNGNGNGDGNGNGHGNGNGGEPAAGPVSTPASSIAGFSSDADEGSAANPEVEYGVGIIDNGDDTWTAVPIYTTGCNAVQLFTDGQGHYRVECVNVSTA